MSFSVGVGVDEWPEDVFLEQVRYAEWFQRKRSGKRKMALRDRLLDLFESLPPEAARRISNDRDRLIADIVRTRNVLVHALQGPEGKRAKGARLKTVLMKLGALLMFHVMLEDHDADYLKDWVKGFSKNRGVGKWLAKSDRPRKGKPIAVRRTMRPTGQHHLFAEVNRLSGPASMRP